MGFIRWRGRCAQLLATIYVDGRSKQVTLAKLSDFYVPDTTKRDVEEKHPDIKVDWTKLARSLARGPSDAMKVRTSDAHLDMAEVENCLRMWASEADKADSNSLYIAAGVLTRWRAKFYQEAELPQKRNTN